MRQGITPAMFESGAQHLPYAKVLKRINSLVRERTKQGGTVLNAMCGSGILAEMILRERPDLHVIGMDNCKAIIQAAEQKNKDARFVCADPLDWSWGEGQLFDCIICYDGLAQMPRAKQPRFVSAIRQWLAPDGIAIFGESCIAPCSNTVERRAAIIQFWQAYADRDQLPELCRALIEKTVTMDKCAKGYRLNVDEVAALLQESFSAVKIPKQWPPRATSYGDYVFIAKP